MTIKGKIVLANLIVFGVLLSALALFVYNRTEQSEMESIDLRLESHAALIIVEFEDEWEEEQIREWDDILQISAEGLQNVQISVRAVDGRLILASDSVAPPSAETLERAMAGQLVKKLTVRDGKEFREIVYPIAIDDTVGFTLTLITPVAETNARLGRLALILFVSVAVALILASTTVYFVTRVSFRPMSQMIATAERISADKLDQRISLSKQNDEVTRLGTALNNMMDRIEAAFKSQRQFVTDASHELRTPLTVIIGELEFLQTQLRQEELKENVRSALGELDHMARLVDQLLTLARIDARKLTLDRKTVRFDELLADCVRLIHKEALSKEIEVRVHVEKAIELQADPIRLKSIVLNLLENAVRYSGNGGTVSAVLREKPVGTAELLVSDTGPGIAVEDRQRVFNRFYRTASARASSNGSGLGLAITKNLVELHRGHIHIEDGSEGGILFRVVIPVSAP